MEAKERQEPSDGKITDKIESKLFEQKTNLNEEVTPQKEAKTADTSKDAQIDTGCAEESKERTVIIGKNSNNLRIAMLGNVDAGKSTLTGVLTSAPGTLDDGNGLLRERVFTFQHERNNGRTSSIAHEIIGFDEDGNQYATRMTHTNKRNKIWPDIVSNSSKIVHLLDMCGHEKYLKTTMHGLTSLFPDYCLLVVAANRGITKMTKEHLGISCALQLPLFIVFTKIDLTPKEVFEENMAKMNRIMKTHCQRVPVIMKTEQDVAQAQATVGQGRICPIFAISACTGEGVELLRKFISVMPMSIVRENTSTEQEEIQKLMKTDEKDEVPETGKKVYHVHTKFIVDSRYFCKGVGLILGGTVLKGRVRLDQPMMFGPDRNGHFKPVVIKGIHENRVEIAEAGQMASVCVHIKTTDKSKPIRNSEIRKGSYLINPVEVKDKNKNPYHSLCVKYFDALVKVLHHHTTIKEGFQGVLHIGGVRQTVQAVQIRDMNCMRANDQGRIRFKFKYGVEFIQKGAKIMVREGNTKAFGTIVETYPMNDPPADLVDNFQTNDAKVGLPNKHGQGVSNPEKKPPFEKPVYEKKWSEKKPPETK